MLQLDRGAAMHHLTQSLTELGYNWAYQVVDARAFGLPQRRHRIVMLASRDENPRAVLFSGNAQPPTELRNGDDPRGVYWTDGSKGGRPPQFDVEDYKGRNVIERSFQRCKQWRGTPPATTDETSTIAAVRSSMRSSPGSNGHETRPSREWSPQWVW